MRRLLCFVVLLLGALGVLASLVAVIAIWSVHARTRRATDEVFARIDGALVVVRERTGQAADRVRSSTITTQGVAEGLKQWTAQQAGQELAERLQVVENSDKLRAGMQQAGAWLDVADSSARLAQQALEFATSLGAQIDTRSVDGLIDEIAALKRELGDATSLAENLREQAVALAEGQAPPDRGEQAVQLALRVAATLGTVDARLDRFGGKLSQAQQNMQALHSQTLSWISLATFVATVLIGWMGLGQLALCWVAWNGLHRGDGTNHTLEPGT